MEESRKFLIIGTRNANVLAQQLRYYGIDAKAMPSPKFLNLFFLKGFDIVYGIYLMSITRHVPIIKALGKKLLVHIVGSDAFRYAETRRGIRKRLWNTALSQSNKVLYVSDNLKRLMGLDNGSTIPIPVDTKMFRKSHWDGIKRDVLYYCPNPAIYRLDWIINYAKNYPDETITILGHSSLIDLPNVEVIPTISYQTMPKLYHSHRSLIRMTTHDGHPKMPYEAVLCGLDVIWNGLKVTKVPEEMLMENTIPKIIKISEEI